MNNTNETWFINGGIAGSAMSMDNIDIYLADAYTIWEQFDMLITQAYIQECGFNKYSTWSPKERRDMLSSNMKKFIVHQ